MNIHFDLVHPSDVNLFKNSINKLHKEGHNLFITLRTRGKLSVIAEKELGLFEIEAIGKHKKNIFNKFFALIIRELLLFRYLKSKSVQISINQSFSSVISCKLLKIPFINIEDDYEYKLTFHYARLFSTRDIMPDFIPAKGRNIYKYHGFKELAYLHPKEFVSDITALRKYNLIPREYVFIREISNISLNYRNRHSYLKQIIETVHLKGKKILLSLEDKSIAKEFQQKCILLEEPVNDIYSLIANALFAISSGDTMAREACLLGTPTIYTGGRHMTMNNPLIREGIMFKEDGFEEIRNKINYILSDDNAKDIRQKAKKSITDEWEDTTEVILNHIKDFMK